MSTLHYHRCDDCLTAFSTPERKVDFCDCNGTVSYMGEVQGDKYIKTEERSVCDGRCTHASGPYCDCKCMGANHGTGKVRNVVVREGKIVAVDLTPEDVERAENYRALRSYAEQCFNNKYGSVMTDIHSGKWVDRPLYLQMYNAKKELDKAISLKVYDKRTKALIEFVSKNK